jgi:hypothetical protein
MEKPIRPVPDDDETHPIPHLGKIDVAIWHKNGGYYGVVIEQPLVDDSTTRARLLKKLDNYLNDFYSEEFSRLHGAPLPGKLPEIFGYRGSSWLSTLAWSSGGKRYVERARLA